MELRNFLSFKFLGNLIKNESYFKTIAIIILYIKFLVKKTGILVKNEEFIYKTFTNKSNFQYYLKELLENEIIAKKWLEESKKRGINKYFNWEDRVLNNPSNVLIYYALIRELKPKLIVETGTASGSMTSFILSALSKNKTGKLISIDLPPQKNKMTMNFSLKRNDIGYWIPEEYKKRWVYISSDAKTKLLEICSKNKVDYFIHL